MWCVVRSVLLSLTSGRLEQACSAHDISDSTVAHLGLFFSKKIYAILQQEGVVVSVPFSLLHGQQATLLSGDVRTTTKCFGD